MTHLKLDLDGRLTTRRLNRVYIALGLCRIRPCFMRIDRTRNGFHVVVGTRLRIAPMALIAFQAIAGSDWKREAFNWNRARRLRSVSKFWRKPSRWNVLYHSHERGVHLSRIVSRSGNR